MFCTDGIFPHTVGGMQRHSRLLIEELVKFTEFDVFVIHPHEQNVFNDSRVTEVKVVPADPKKNYLLECYRYSRRVYDAINRLNPDIVYAQGLTAWYKLNKIKCPVIVNPHGLEPYQAISFKEKIIAIPFKLVFNSIFRKANYVVSLGGGLTSILKKRIPKEKLIELPNATSVVPPVQHNYNAPVIKFLFVARFAANKGIHVLMQAVQNLNQMGYQSKTEYYLAGKGPLFDYYSQSFKYSNVHYLGFVSDEQLGELYRFTHAFVFPTLFEGMPTVVIEAMMNGQPVIVSDVGATAVLVDDTNGYLITKNSVDELQQAIIKFCNLSPDQQLQMSMASRQKAEASFTWTEVAKKHSDFFTQILKK